MRCNQTGIRMFQNNISILRDRYSASTEDSSNAVLDDTAENLSTDTSNTAPSGAKLAGPFLFGVPVSEYHTLMSAYWACVAS